MYNGLLDTFPLRLVRQVIYVVHPPTYQPECQLKSVEPTDLYPDVPFQIPLFHDPKNAPQIFGARSYMFIIAY